MDRRPNFEVQIASLLPHSSTPKCLRNSSKNPQAMDLGENTQAGLLELTYLRIVLNN